MEKIYKFGEYNGESINEGDIVEISDNVFIRVSEISLITEENLAGQKKTNMHLKGEIISNEKPKRVRRKSKTDSSI